MTITIASSAVTYYGTQVCEPETAQLSSGVLIIESMPVGLRSVVEDLMVDCVRSDSDWSLSGADVLTAQWFTHWYRQWPGRIGCRQVLTGTRAELGELHERVSALALNYGFSARVSL